MRILFFIFVCVVYIGGVRAADVDDSGGDTSYPDEILCAPVSEYVKCAKLPEVTVSEDIMGNVLIMGDYVTGSTFSDAVVIDDENWSHVRDGVPIVGVGTDVSSSTLGPYYVYSAYCKIISPYSATFYADNRVRATSDISAAELCANIATNSSMSGENGVLISEIPAALDGDVCPDGFYTVPYETWCGDGMVNIAGVPNCADDVSGEYCLQDTASVTVPCASGISVIKTSTGMSFALHAEKYTEPALAVKYSDSVCWCNLELGASENAINIMFNDVVYHTVN